MAAFVLDASVAISWCFPGDLTEDTPYSRRILKELEVNDAIVPEIWAFEVANSIFVSISKRKRISEQQIGEYLGLLKALPIRVEPQTLWSNVGLQALARRHGITAYDAAYMDLALRTNLPLVWNITPATYDLRRAAAQSGFTTWRARPRAKALAGTASVMTEPAPK
jgi:predicted nucleic acid-binding protein